MASLYNPGYGGDQSAQMYGQTATDEEERRRRQAAQQQSVLLNRPMVEARANPFEFNQQSREPAAGDSSTQARNTQQQQTFAQLQAAGQARPAPPPQQQQMQPQATTSERYTGPMVYSQASQPSQQSERFTGPMVYSQAQSSEVNPQSREETGGQSSTQPRNTLPLPTPSGFDGDISGYLQRMLNTPGQQVNVPTAYDAASDAELQKMLGGLSGNNLPSAPGSYYDATKDRGLLDLMARLGGLTGPAAAPTAYNPMGDKDLMQQLEGLGGIKLPTAPEYQPDGRLFSEIMSLTQSAGQMPAGNQAQLFGRPPLERREEQNRAPAPAGVSAQGVDPLAATQATARPPQAMTQQAMPQQPSAQRPAAMQAPQAALQAPQQAAPRQGTPAAAPTAQPTTIRTTDGQPLRLAASSANANPQFTPERIFGDFSKNGFNVIQGGDGIITVHAPGDYRKKMQFRPDGSRVAPDGMVYTTNNQLVPEGTVFGGANGEPLIPHPSGTGFVPLNEGTLRDLAARGIEPTQEGAGRFTAGRQVTRREQLAADIASTADMLQKPDQFPIWTEDQLPAVQQNLEKMRSELGLLESIYGPTTQLQGFTRAQVTGQPEAAPEPGLPASSLVAALPAQTLMPQQGMAGAAVSAQGLNPLLAAQAGAGAPMASAVASNEAATAGGAAAAPATGMPVNQAMRLANWTGLADDLQLPGLSAADQLLGSYGYNQDLARTEAAKRMGVPATLDAYGYERATTGLSEAQQGRQSGQYDAQQQAILDTLANPSAFDNAEVQRLYEQLGQGIDDRFAQEETALREEMAARGLSDSSIQGGRLADLNVGRRSARTELANQLATQRAQDFAQARAQAIGMAQQQRDQDLAERQFVDQLDLNRQAAAFDQMQGTEGMRLARELGYDQLGLQRQMGLAELDLNRLGTQANILRDYQRLALDAELGRGNLGVEAELGRGNLDVSRQRANTESAKTQQDILIDQQRANLDTELGRGNLALGRERAAVEAELGRGNLALEGELGRGNLTLAQQRAATEAELGRGNLALESELGRGNLSLSQQRAAADAAQAQAQMALAQRAQAFTEEQGRAGIDLNRDRFGLEQTLGLGNLDLNRTLGLGNLDISRDRAALDRTLGLGNLGIAQQRLGLDTQGQAFGQRMQGLQFQNQVGQQGFQNQMSSAELAARLAGQQFTQGLQSAQFRNQLGQQDFTNRLASSDFDLRRTGQQFNQGMQTAQFQNQLGQQTFTNQLSNTELAARLAGQQFNQNLQGAQFRNQLGQQGFTNQMSIAELNRALGNDTYSRGMGYLDRLIGVGQDAFNNDLRREQLNMQRANDQWRQYMDTQNLYRGR